MFIFNEHYKSSKQNPNSKEFYSYFNRVHPRQAGTDFTSGIKIGKYSNVPADKEHQNSFLKIDRNTNMSENFVKNFRRQLKAPTRFSILSVKEDTLDSPKVRQAIEDLTAGKQTKAVEDFLKKNTRSFHAT